MKRIEVIHTGDPTKNIKGTGAMRLMGEDQFKLYGKDNGWSLLPATKKTEKDETSADSPSTSDSKGNRVNVSSFNAKDLIAKIKELGGAGDLNAIGEIKEAEEAQEDPRSTVLAATDKYLTKND